MADIKRFYWIKLKTNFFSREDIDFLLSQKNGAEYVVLYQMLCLSTANNDGRLESKIGEMLVPYNAEKIVRDCKYFDIDTVNIAMALYRKLGLIYEEKDNVLVISNHEEMVGSETSSAQRVREWRKKKLLQCNEKVTADVTQEYRDKSIDNRDIDNRDKNLDNNIPSLHEPTKLLEDNVGTKCPTEYRDKSLEYRDKSIDNRDNNIPSFPEQKKLNEKVYNEEFEKLWQYYPKKQGKEDARKKYIIARKDGTTYEEIANGLRNYITYIKSENIEEKYIKHGSTWFNQKCWNDDYKITKKPTGKVDNQMEFLKGVYDGTIKVN